MSQIPIDKTSEPNQSLPSTKFETGDAELDRELGRYFKYEKNKDWLLAVEALYARADVDELRRILLDRLCFGTAGIRGNMGPGFGQMNELVIIQTSQGLASYLLDHNREETLKRGVIIGNDARHNSPLFARLAALAFLQKNIPVYFCGHIVPTPYVAFGVRRYNCMAGVMVTASHNPKNDNGYKVYFENGAQILTPHDKHIQSSILLKENQRPWPLAWQEGLLVDKNVPKGWLDAQLIRFIYSELNAEYNKYVSEALISDSSLNASSNIRITYTSMHGVAHSFMTKALKLAGFTSLFPVEAQRQPDPEFPTVRFPNPEESGALDLAFDTAKETNSNLILANDPDADRCAAAQYCNDSQKWYTFTGNELGFLLGWWSWHCHLTGSSQSSKDDIRASSLVNNAGSKAHKFIADCAMISTAVSSKFLQSMAQVEGFQFFETLTGFKYMGNLAHELMTKHDKHVLFAYEEAIGYMVNPTILDKDGISACLQVAQMAAYLSSVCNRTLVEHLDCLYAKYGFHYNINSYYICHDKDLIPRLFHKLQNNYPKKLAGFRVIRVRDLNNGYDSGTADHRALLPTSSSSFMVTFFTENDASITIRTSGTEPKIKYYSEIIVKKPSSAQTNESAERSHELNNCKVVLTATVDAAIEYVLKPKENGLRRAGQ